MTRYAYFDARLRPALSGLLEGAARAGAIRADVDASDLLFAAGGLCMFSHGDGRRYAERMAALLLDGLRFGAALK